MLGRASYGRLWALRTNSPAAGPVLDLRYSYDAEGNVIRLQDAKYGAGGWPTTGFSFQDSFSSNWTWSSYQTVPDGSNGWVKSVGTGASWESSFYRSSYSLTSGEGLEVRLKVSQDDTLAHVSLEADDSTYRRFGVIAENGKLWVQVMDGSTNVHPAVLLADLQANTWYVVRLVVGDASGFYAEAYQLDTPAVRGSYHSWMLTGKSWRFHHWIYRGTAWLDDYREFSTGGLSWSPRDWMSASYDALDRLLAVAPLSGWQGYSGAYAYNAVGNVTSFDGVAYGYNDAAHVHAVTDVGPGHDYAYDPAGNMVTRVIDEVTYALSYDAENRLVGVSGGATASFVYDGDGRRVKGTVGGVTTLYVSPQYEVAGGVVHEATPWTGKRVALREGGVLSYLLADALGSTSLALDASGTPTESLRYKPYG